MRCTVNFARPLRLSLAASLASLVLAGCHVTSRQNGNNKNVDIGTPFGSMQVKTNDETTNASLGLTPYPGAVTVKDDGDNSSADVNMSFGNFHLGVVARSLQTGDSQDKVLAFYRKDLGRYGDVIECKGNVAFGGPSHTSQGLSCSDKDHNHSSSGASGDNLELRAGSPLHQHIVAVELKNGGTRIGLVKLDLPSVVNLKDDKES
jgi:hypothetical protein